MPTCINIEQSRVRKEVSLNLHLVHFCDPEEKPESQLILNPVRRLNGFFEHGQHRRKRKEPLLKAARLVLARLVPSLSIDRNLIQNPLQQEGCDLLGRSDSN